MGRPHLHRFYDPITDTFLSVDPMVGVTGDPYGYVSGDPVNGVDPLGLFCWGMCSFTDAAHNAVHAADTVRHAAASAGHWVDEHKTGIIEIAAFIAIAGVVIASGGILGLGGIGLYMTLVAGSEVAADVSVAMIISGGLIAGGGGALAVGGELLPGPQTDPVGGFDQPPSMRRDGCTGR